MMRASTQVPTPLIDPMPPAPEENRIGPYELVGMLARGGMGTVYLCRKNGLAGFERLSALKLMHAHLSDETGFLTMFLDEARIAARIHHANVVSVLDLDVSPRGHYVVMEYVEGATLAQLLSRTPNQRSARILAPVIIDLLAGLQAAHELRDERGQLLELVHRDVSPTNVLIGVDGVARITDFGIAKARARITSTQPDVRKATLSYAAPEQMRATSSVDARTDIFATGVVLWNALTGLSLFRGATDAETVHNIMNRKIPAPSTVGLRPPPCFDEICLRALERDPDRRFQSAAEMGEALRLAASRSGLLGTPSEVGRMIARCFALELAARRKALREAARPIILPAPPMVPAFLTPPPIDRPRARTTPPPPPRPRATTVPPPLPARARALPPPPARRRLPRLGQVVAATVLGAGLGVAAVFVPRALDRAGATSVAAEPVVDVPAATVEVEPTAAPAPKVASRLAADPAPEVVMDAEPKPAARAEAKPQSATAKKKKKKTTRRRHKARRSAPVLESNPYLR